MVPLKGEWTPFKNLEDQLEHYRLWGLIPPKSTKLRPIMVTDGYFGVPQPCKVVGYQRPTAAVIELDDGYHAIHGEYLAELQPIANQKLPYGMCFVEILSQYIVLDIETTGFDFRHDRIIEIAAIKYEYGKKVAEFHSLVNPEMLIPERITQLTEIAQIDVVSAPTLPELEEAFFEFIGSTPLIGHNAISFDVPFLSAQLSKPLENCVLDTLYMSRKVFDLLPQHKLEYLNEVLHLGSAGSHRAFNDVETTNALMWACLSPRRFESKVNKAFLDHRLSGKKTFFKPRKNKPVHAPMSPAAPAQPKFPRVDIKSIVPNKTTFDESNPLYGKNVVFTGDLSISREEAMQLAVDAGALLKSSISGKTNYLVVGTIESGGMTSKEKKARELNGSGKANIQLLTEKDYLTLVKKEGAVV